MTTQEWDEDFARCLGVFLSGDALLESDARGRPIHDASFLLLFNAHHDTIGFRLPEIKLDGEWFAQIDTAFETGRPQLGALPGGSEYPLQGRSLVLLRRIDRNP
jgi:glycogen operon protein